MGIVIRSRIAKFLLVVVVLTMLAVGLYLHNRPSDTLDVATYRATWQAQVDSLVKGRQSAPSSCWAAQGSLATLPGFGAVDSLCWTSISGHQLNFRFIQKTPSSVTELLYMPESSDWKLQYDFCVVQLSGPWWELRSSNSGCPRGFTFVPAA